MYIDFSLITRCLFLYPLAEGRTSGNRRHGCFADKVYLGFTGGKMKRLTVFALAAMWLTSSAATAAPFSDVPFSHWAYDSINHLAARGILQGYPDGKFKGNNSLTRFDLAMVTAKTLANVEQMFDSGRGTNLVNRTDLQVLEGLTTEFADELALLGVKITSLEDDMAIAKEDVALLKKDVEDAKGFIARGGLEKVKLSGDILVRHTNLTHKHDWLTGAFGQARPAGNSDNSLTESSVNINFSANIDENISAEVYWSMLDYHTAEVNSGQSGMQSAFGTGGIGAVKRSDNTIYLAYLEIRNMFRFGGDFIFGRNLYAHNHSLLLNNYVDAVRYNKKIGDVNLTLQTIFDRHRGSFKDDNAVDFRGVYNLDLNTEHRGHTFYLGLYGQNEPYLLEKRGIDVAGLAPFLDYSVAGGVQPLGNTIAGQQTGDRRWDLEFGSKGPIGASGRWSYDLGFAYTRYELDVMNTAGSDWISPELSGWTGHGAIKWDSKKQWAAKIAGTFADEDAVGAISILNDFRYQDEAETPYEDIGRGNAWFDTGLINMYDIKLQTEYRPTDSKHYFRLAGDFIGETKDTAVNDLTRHVNGEGSASAAVPAIKDNSAYDRYNNLGIADPTAVVLTFEYRYQLAENTRLRLGYTTFDMTGSAVRKTLVPATGKISAGRGFNDDYDYHMLWTEVYSCF